MGRECSAAQRLSGKTAPSHWTFLFLLGLVATAIVIGNWALRARSSADQAVAVDLFEAGSTIAAAEAIPEIQDSVTGHRESGDLPTNGAGHDSDGHTAPLPSLTSTETESVDPVETTALGPATTSPSTTAPPTSRPATTAPATTTAILDPPTEVAANSGTEQAEFSSDAFYLSVNGSDASPGTREDPWRTLERAASALEPGSTLVVGPGTYGARGSITRIAVDGTASAPILIVGDPTKPRPIILGAVRVVGDHLKLRHLIFDGPTGAVLARTSTNPLGEDVQIAIYGDDVEISNCEIRDNLWHAGIYLDGADDARIIDNHIHHNGNFARSEQANLDHGIYFESGSGLVSGNFIENNLAFGVHLYPDADGVIVEHNTIASHGRDGVIIAANASNNLVRANVVAYNARAAVGTWRLTGTGNLVSNNTLWGNGAGDLGTDIGGLTFSANVVREIAFPVVFQSDPGPR